MVCIVTAVALSRTYSAAFQDAVYTRSVHYGATSGQREVLAVRDLPAVGWRHVFTSVTRNMLVEGSEATTGVLAVRDEQHVHLWRG